MASPKTDDGFILVSRSLEDSKVFQNEKWLKVWIWCLMRANHTTTQFPVKTGRGNTTVTLKRGQFIFGRNSAGKKLKMPPSTVRNIVYKLATWQNLDIKEDTHYSIVTIRNYEQYQNPESYKRTGKRTTKGQAKDTYNNDNNDNKKNIGDSNESFSLSQEKNKPKGNGKNPKVRSLIEYFHSLCKEELDLKPTIEGSKDGSAIKRTLTKNSEEQIKNIFQWYIKSPKAQEHGLKIAVALSDHSLSEYEKKGKWLYDG